LRGTIRLIEAQARRLRQKGEETHPTFFYKRTRTHLTTLTFVLHRLTF